jgi:hypothetical protein
MKRILFVLLLSLSMLGMMQRRADFGGTWKMAIVKSKNLPPSFKNVKVYQMNIQQTPDSMTVIVGFEGMGQKVVLPPSVYVFDGNERYREDTARGSKRWTKSTWTTTGQKLIMTSRVIQSRPGRESRYTETDTWELTGSSTLRLHVDQKFEGKDSTNSEIRVFRRVGK